jgi:thymidine phosphorylase
VARCGKRKRDTAAILVGSATPRENVQFLKNPHHEGTALDVRNSGVVCDKHCIGL